jgi:hypothetical protein
MADSKIDIFVQVKDIDELFNAPPIDPLSSNPAAVLGEAGLAYVVRQELGRGLHNWQGRRLVILLPPDQITPELQARVEKAIRHYAMAKKTENEILIRLSRWRSLVGLLFAIFVAGVLALTGLLLTSVIFPSASDTAKALLVGLLTIFIWATVWNPWDRLVFEWVEPYMENRILNSVKTMEIVVQGDPQLDEA